MSPPNPPEQTANVLTLRDLLVRSAFDTEIKSSSRFFNRKFRKLGQAYNNNAAIQPVLSSYIFSINKVELRFGTTLAQIYDISSNEAGCSR